MKWQPALEKIKPINNIPNLNFGGCGYAAIALYHSLKQEGLEPQIVFFSNRNRDLKGYRAPGHAVVRVKNGYRYKYLDAQGEWTSKDYKLKKVVSLDYLKKSLENRDTWNESFDRKNVKKIEKIIKIKLEEVK
jgi:hypothetical protein